MNLSNPIYHKPKSYIAAKNLFYTSIVFSIINLLLSDLVVGFNTYYANMRLMITLISSLLIFILIKQVSFRRNWARWVLLLLFIIELIFLPYTLNPLFDVNLLIAALIILQAALQILALIFLFSKKTNEWFNKPS